MHDAWRWMTSMGAHVRICPSSNSLARSHALCLHVPSPPPRAPYPFLPLARSPPTPTPPQVELGSGTYGKVYRGGYRCKKVAIKILGFVQDKQKETFLQEVSMVYGLSHPNIITFYGGAIKKKTKGDEGWLVFELMNNDLST